MKNINTLYQLFIIILFVSINTRIQAQNVPVCGYIYSTNKETVDVGNVVFYNLPDSTIAVIGDILQGQFNTTLQKNQSYMLRVVAIGYRDTLINLQKIVQNDTFRITNINISPVSSNLESVIIKANTPIIEQRPGSVTLNIANRGIFDGENAQGILNKIPGMAANDGTIKYKNKNNLAVYIDGVRMQEPLLTAVLKSLQAADIEKIEVINNPSAKYDADAQGGVIEITTKRKGKKGLSAMIECHIFQKHYFNNSQWGQLTYNNAKWNISTAFGRFDFANYNISDYTRDFIDNNGNIYLNLKQNVIRAERPFYYNNRTNIRYYLSPKHQFGASVHAWTESMQNTFNNQNTATDAMEKVSTIATNVSAKPATNFQNGGLQYMFKSDSARHSINATANFMRFSFADTQNYIETVSNSSFSRVFERKSNGGNLILIGTGKIDYSYTAPNKSLKIEIGIKAVSTQTDNNQYFANYYNNIWYSDSLRINHSTYTENISTGYCQIKKNIKKWDFMAGLRMENTAAQVFSVLKNKALIDNKYSNYFPSASIIYNINPDLAIGASFASTIRRPTLQDIDPFLLYIDSLSYSQGNIALQPERKQNYELSLTYKQQAGLSLEYGETNGLFDAYVKPFATNSNISVLTTRNYNQLRYASAAINAPFPVTKWLMTFTGLGATHNQYEIGDGQNNINGTMFYIGQWIECKIKKPKCVVELNWQYNSSGVNGIFKFQPMFGCDLSIKKKFFDDKLALTFRVNDIFYSRINNVNAELTNLHIAGTNRNDSRSIRLTLQYTFGNIVKPNDTSVNADEKQRIKMR